MLQFTGADAERERPQCAQGTGVRVGTDEAKSGQGDPLLRADQVGDALIAVIDIEHRQPERGGTAA